MIFVDASAIVAVLFAEPEAPRFVEVLKTREGKITSPVAVYESTLAIFREHGDIDWSRENVARFLREAGIGVMPIGPAEQEASLDAFARFGKGNHPAKLNMGDCFAYACAKTAGARLLYKGADFAQTDITPAV